MTKTSKTLLLLDTSAVIYQMHGDPRMQEAVRHAAKGGQIWLSYFIRMEYLRGIIFNLIELYFLIKEENSVRDALVVWTQTKVNQPRKFTLVLMTISDWMTTQDDYGSHEKSLRRLGELIVGLVRGFDELSPRRIKDELQCELGRVGFPRRSFSEELLLAFYERFKSIRSGTPACHLCDFKLRQQQRLTRERVDLVSEVQRSAQKQNKGFVKQAERLEKALQYDDTTPKCRWCEQLGDSIIALHIRPKRMVLVTADRAFQAFGAILGRQVRHLPSAAALKRQAARGTSQT